MTDFAGHFKIMLADQKQRAGFEFDYGPLLDQLLAGISSSQVAVELGTFIGCGCAYMAQSFLARGVQPLFFTVDTFEPYAGVDNVYGELLRNLKGCGLLGRVVPLCSQSSTAAKLFEDASVSFLWVDADHRYEGVRRDLLAWYPKMAKGAILAGHDLSEPGVKQAVDELCAQTGLTYSVYNPDGWKSWWTRVP